MFKKIKIQNPNSFTFTFSPSQFSLDLLPACLCVCSSAPFTSPLSPHQNIVQPLRLRHWFFPLPSSHLPLPLPSSLFPHESRLHLQCRLVGSSKPAVTPSPVTSSKPATSPRVSFESAPGLLRIRQKVSFSYSASSYFLTPSPPAWSFLALSAVFYGTEPLRRSPPPPSPPKKKKRSLVPPPKPRSGLA